MFALDAAPIPLATRAQVGRAAAAVLAGLVVLAGVIGISLNRDNLAVPPLALVALISGLAVLFAWVARGQWTTRLGHRSQEAVLAALCLVPTATAIAYQATDDSGTPSALLFVLVIATVSPLIVRRHAHTGGVLLAALALGLTESISGISPQYGFALAILLAVGLLSGLAAGVIGDAVVTAAVREQEAADANRALRAVVDAARTATTSEPTAVLDAVTRATANLNSDTAGVYLLHADGNLRYGTTYNIPEHLHDEVFPPTHGMAGQALTHDRTVSTNDYTADDRGMFEYKQAGLHAAVASPIRVDGTPVGVLVAGRFETGGYSEAEITALELLADHAGHALALSRAIDEDRQLLQRLQSLRALQQDFVATVSHELRTPLTVIDGLAETLEHRRHGLSERQLIGLLSRLRVNTTALVTIVTSLLDAARLDRGLVEVDAGEVDLWDLVEGCVGRLGPVLVDHNIEINLDDVVIVGDADLLARVIDNLLTNAERHTPAGTTVRIEARTVGDECTVVISDNGPGIDHKDLDRITERFTRGGELHTRSSRGLGLGLALTDQILRLHGTRLLVTSPPGEGARFQFRLRTVHVPELTRRG